MDAVHAHPAIASYPVHRRNRLRQHLRAASPDFWNSATIDYWSTGPGGNGISSGPLSVPNEADATSPGQSTYNQGRSFTYPDTCDTGGAPTYWVDVEITPSSTPPVADSGAFLAFFP